MPEKIVREFPEAELIRLKSLNSKLIEALEHLATHGGMHQPPLRDSVENIAKNALYKEQSTAVCFWSVYNSAWHSQCKGKAPAICEYAPRACPFCGKDVEVRR